MTLTIDIVPLMLFSISAFSTALSAVSPVPLEVKVVNGLVVLEDLKTVAVAAVVGTAAAVAVLMDHMMQVVVADLDILDQTEL